MQNSLFLTLILLATNLTAFSPSAHAGVTVSEVARASRVEGLGTATVTIYGGVAGSLGRCNTTAADALCNNCNITEAESTGLPAADPDTLLLACNNQRIHPDLQLLLSVSSDAVDGRITLTNSDGNSALAPVSVPANLTKGSVGQIAFRWSDVCTRVISVDTNSGGEGATLCAPTSGHASASFRFGISNDGDDLLNGSGDDYRTVTIIIRGTEGASIATDCDDAATDPRICYFEMGPGDEKAIVKSLQKPDGSSFPTGQNTTYKFLRFLFDNRGFDHIHMASSYVDLPIEAADTTSFNVNPRRIEGLTNDTAYYFKVAAVDAAGNVGLYSGKDTDADCQYSGIPGDTTCRVVTPSEVVGVLDNTNCFIATAAYGSSFADELTVLRDFRDQILIPTKIGKLFVKAYYTVSPTIAKWILKSDDLRSLTRKALVPFVWFAGISLAWGENANTWLWILIAAAVAFSVVIRVAASRPRRSQEGPSKPEQDRSWPGFVFALISSAALAAALATAPAAHAQDLEPLEETPPPAEFPYPGATEPTQPPAQQGEVSKSPKTTTRKKRAPKKFSDVKTPTKSNGYLEKPKAINDDGDFVYETLPEGSVREYGEPEPIKFSNAPGREAPQSISKDGEFRYPVAVSDYTASGSIRFGMMNPPSLKNASNGLTFKDIYGDGLVPALLFDYEYPFTRALGRLGLKAESGFIASSARGRFKSSARLGELPEERFTFLMIPLQATVIYRIQFADTQWIVPFVEGGGVYYGIAEIRDDGKAPRLGGAPAAVAAGGVRLLLDWIDPHSIRQLDADYGINHVWLTLQYRQIVGVKKDLDVSTQMATAGFTFDF